MNNDLEQFSEERLKKMTIGHIYPTTIEMAALARISLAAKQAKPVGYVLCNHGNPDIDFVFADEDSAIGTSEHLNDDADGRDEWTVMPFYTTPQPAHTEQDGWISIPRDMLADYRDVKNSELQSYKASFGSHCDIPGSRWQRDLADLTEELAEIDKLIAAAPKPESE